MKKKINLIIIEDCIEKLCKKSKKRAMKIINDEKKEKISLIKNKKYVIYVKKSFVWIKMMKIIKIEKG